MNALKLADDTMVSKTRPDSGLYDLFHSSFEVVVADSETLREEIFALRYQVYCVEHPFEDPREHLQGRETDSHDARSVHALVRHRATGLCAGAVRLVLHDPAPGVGPLPIEAHCGHAFHLDSARRLAALPQRQIAEISRFAVSKDFRRRLGEAARVEGVAENVSYFDNERFGDWDARRILPHITVGLFAGIVRLSFEQGVDHWLAVMEPALLRMLRRFGIRFETIGPDTEYHGIRRPSYGPVSRVLDGIRAQRPEVWNIITDHGRYAPGRHSSLNPARALLRPRP